MISSEFLPTQTEFCTLRSLSFSGKRVGDLTITNYESNLDVNWGDHKPVFAQVELKGVIVTQGQTYESNETSHCTLI